MRIVVSAGGTGGHIYPALSIIKKIKEKNKDAKILYIGTKDRMEKDIVPKQGIEYIGIDIKGINRKNIISNFSVISKFYKAIKECKRIIKDFKPDLVIGVGGYITTPAIYAAHKLKIKTIIHEQNLIPGLSNKFLSRYTDKVLISLQDSYKYFPKNKTIFTGNPRSEEAYNTKEININKYNLKKPFIIIVMGSLGSMSINKKIKEIIPSFKNKYYDVLLITGNNYIDDYKNIEVSKNVHIIPFTNDLISLMKSAKIMISRAGASTLAEIIASKIPSILVPSPYVTNNHQYKNALLFKENNSALLLEEKDFNASNLIEKIDYLMDNETVYNDIKNNLSKLYIPNSCSAIYREIKNLVGGNHD